MNELDTRAERFLESIRAEGEAACAAIREETERAINTQLDETRKTENARVERTLRFETERAKTRANRDLSAARMAARATLAGAEGGCQAEVGAASAMAAAALVDIRGGTAEQCAEAFAMALTNLEGLVCDPVAGLVEIPCIKRNVIGAVNAVSAANMAVAGITSRIPVDEVIDAMGEVGDALPASLRETGLGGLAATPTGRQAAERIARAEH